MKRFTAFAPISSGNFIVGFDILGAALQPVDGSSLGDWVTVEDCAQTETYIRGPYADVLPENPADNLVCDCRRVYERELAFKAVPSQPNRMILYKALPVGSGLGSSAASAVAALMALNAFYDEALCKQELLILAGEMEGLVSGGVHYDNVAPAIFGGLRLMVPDSRLSVGLPLPPWQILLYHPGIEVATREARSVLPANYSLHSLTSFAGRLAAFVQAAVAEDWDHALGLLSDELIEQYRAPLVPRFFEAKHAALASGALAFSFSGSGPTCLAVCPDSDTANRISSTLQKTFPKQPGRKSWLCRFDSCGARSWKGPMEDMPKAGSGSLHELGV